LSLGCKLICGHIAANLTDFELETVDVQKINLRLLHLFRDHRLIDVEYVYASRRLGRIEPPGEPLSVKT
jgi:hypothetical protein